MNYLMLGISFIFPTVFINNYLNNLLNTKKIILQLIKKCNTHLVIRKVITLTHYSLIYFLTIFYELLSKEKLLSNAE